MDGTSKYLTWKILFLDLAAMALTLVGAVPLLVLLHQLTATLVTPLVNEGFAADSPHYVLPQMVAVSIGLVGLVALYVFAIRQRLTKEARLTQTYGRGKLLILDGFAATWFVIGLPATTLVAMFRVPPIGITYDHPNWSNIYENFDLCPIRYFAVYGFEVFVTAAYFLLPVLLYLFCYRGFIRKNEV